MNISIIDYILILGVAVRMKHLYIITGRKKGVGIIGNEISCMDIAKHDCILVLKSCLLTATTAFN